MKLVSTIFLILLLSPPGLYGLAAKSLPLQDSSNAMEAEAAAARDLGAKDPAVRQRGAETLARLAAVSQRTLAEGYRLQEKNSRVRLALDWALYRMGKDEALFYVVKDLGSDRQSQAVTYLSQLESPDPLYKFLGRGRSEAQIGLLEVFARIGNEETLGPVRNYMKADNAEVADAAKLAEQQISLRLAHKPAQNSSRPRRTREEGQNP